MKCDKINTRECATQLKNQGFTNTLAPTSVPAPGLSPYSHPGRNHDPAFGAYCALDIFLSFYHLHISLCVPTQYISSLTWIFQTIHSLLRTAFFPRLNTLPLTFIFKCTYSSFILLLHSIIGLAEKTCIVFRIYKYVVKVWRKGIKWYTRKFKSARILCWQQRG